MQRVLDGITVALVKEGRVELRNFGVFEVKRRKPRKARNPKSGQAVLVPDRAVVKFQAGKQMAKSVGVALPASEEARPRNGTQA